MMISNLKIPPPNLLERQPNYIHLQYRNDPTITAYKVRVASSLDDAYGTANGVVGAGTEVLFVVERGDFFGSQTILRKGLQQTGSSGNARGQTRALYDPEDFFNPPVTVTVPPDDQIAYIRTQIRKVSTAFPVGADNTNQSVIKIIPPPFFMTTFWPVMSLYGTAPQVALAAGSLPTEQTMRIMVPSFVRTVTLTNLDAGVGLLYSPQVDLPLLPLAAGNSVSSNMGSVICICSAGGNPKFSMVMEFQPLGDQ